MASSSSSASSPLADHVQALYPLARILVGSEEAASLVKDVYSHAADVPPAERPDDERGWLFQLMIDHRNGTLHPAGAEVQPRGETSFTDDPFRREVAAQTAERALPVAFAACSIHERLILAIDVLADPSDEALAMALDTTATNARSIRDRARSALRASLRDVLHGPERMLVDVALPDETLQAHLQTLVEDRFQPTPSSLQSTVHDILAQARAERTAESADSDASSNVWGLLSGLRNGRFVRFLLGVLLLLGVLTAGVLGASQFFSSGPSTTPSQSVVSLAADHSPTLETSSADSPSEAAAHIRDTWDRRVSVPTIEGTSLQGVGRLQGPSRIEVPVLLYAEESSEQRIAVYAFNYALVDSLGDQATLDRSLRTDLAANRSLLTEERPDRAVVLWRQQDDIFVAVAPHLSASSLRSRIRP